MDAKTLKAGLKKLRSLVNVKIRLAEEHGTVELDRSPLPLVKAWYDLNLKTVDDAKDFFREELRRMHRASLKEVPKVVFCAFDVIEGVKHEFEPEKYLYQSGVVPSGIQRLSLDIMTDYHREGAVYIGEPGSGVDRDRWAGGVVSVLARLLMECLEKGVISSLERLGNVDAKIGRFTLLNYVTGVALKLSGADVKTEFGEGSRD